MDNMNRFLQNTTQTPGELSEHMVPQCLGYFEEQSMLNTLNVCDHIHCLGVYTYTLFTIVVLSLVFNTLALIVLIAAKCIYKLKKHSSEYGIFVCLCLTDWLFGLLTLLTLLDTVLSKGEQMALRQSPKLCLMSILIIHSLIGVSEVILATAGVVRCYIIMNVGTVSANWFEKKKAYVFLVSVLCTVISVLAPELASGFKTDDLCVRGMFTCDHSDYQNIVSQAIVVLVTNITFITIMVVTYSIITTVAVRSQRLQITTRNMQSLQSRSKMFKPVRVTIILVGLFIAGWTPTCAYMIQRIMLEGRPSISTHLPSTSPIFLNLISAINPLIYVLLTRKYLKVLKKIFKRVSHQAANES